MHKEEQHFYLIDEYVRNGQRNEFVNPQQAISRSKIQPKFPS